MSKFIVITTIHEKTKAIAEFEKLDGWHVVLVGDVKSVPIKNTDKLTFLSINDQEKLGFALTKLSTKNHYARKNMGYLFAIKNGAEVIYDTDDDNIPYPDWSFPPFECDLAFKSDYTFVNIYKYFTKDFIWPRGFPLDEIQSPYNGDVEKTLMKKIGIWQGIADRDPDIDAIHRLLFNKSIIFSKKPSAYLPTHHYTPINSQNTLWNKSVFPLLYLPATVSFRFTDILRGYIAQRLCWESKFHVGFTSANVYQERNQHDLMHDFALEVQGFLSIKEIIQHIDNLTYRENILINLLEVYSRLVNFKIIADKELSLCKAWLDDVNKLII